MPKLSWSNERMMTPEFTRWRSWRKNLYKKGNNKIMSWSKEIFWWKWTTLLLWNFSIPSRPMSNFSSPLSIVLEESYLDFLPKNIAFRRTRLSFMLLKLFWRWNICTAKTISTESTLFAIQPQTRKCPNRCSRLHQAHRLWSFQSWYEGNDCNVSLWHSWVSSSINFIQTRTWQACGLVVLGISYLRNDGWVAALLLKKSIWAIW